MNSIFSILDILDNHNASNIGNTIGYEYIEVFYWRDMLHIILQSKLGINYNIVHIAKSKMVVKINWSPGKGYMSTINYSIGLNWITDYIINLEIDL